MKKEMGCKKEILFSIGLIFILTFLVFVFGASTMNVPISFGNYSTTLTIGIIVDSNGVNNITNITCYHNASGQAAETFLTQMLNESVSDFTFNDSVDISALTNSKYYNITCRIYNGTTLNKTITLTNVTLDSTAPNVSFSSLAETIDTGNYTTFININTTVADVIRPLDSVYVNITNSNGVEVNFSKINNLTATRYNLSINTSLYAEGKYNVTIYANDTLNNANRTEKIQITIDNTAPTATYTCAESSIELGGSLLCTCTPSDGGIGINSSATVNDSVDTSTGGLHTLTCTYADWFGHTGTTTTTYTVTSSSGGSTTSTSTTQQALTEKTSSWTKITTASNALMRDFGSNSGVNQIEIQVSAETTNARVTVDEYSSKPTELSVSQSNSYRYIHVSTSNLASNLEKAIMKIKVEKSWVTQRGIGMNDVALYRYDETSNVWNELTTTFDSEDSTYYYYTVELNSFSYFSIAPKAVVSTTSGEETTPTGETESSTPISIWIWIVAVLFVLGIITIVIITLSKKKR